MMVLEAVTMEPPTPLYPEALRAAEIVRERWCQGDYGDPGGPRCILGAVREAMGYDESPLNFFGSQLYWALKSAVGEMSLLWGDLASWNDAEDRTREEVAELLERVAWGL